MRYSYQPRGVCSMQINFDINDSVVTNIEFIGGCNGIEGKTEAEG